MTSIEDIQKQMAKLETKQQKEQKILDDLVDGVSQTPLQHIRQHSFGVTVGLAVALISPSIAKANIFDIPMVQGNGRAVQNAAENDLKKYTTDAEIDKRLQEKVTTTSNERALLQNFAVCYAFNNKQWYVDKKDGTPLELMNATKVYTALTAELSKNKNYIQLSGMLPQQKIAYDISFALQQLGYDKDAEGNTRNFDMQNHTYTNDLVISIIDFQNSEDIKKDGIVGPETLRHLLHSLQKSNSSIAAKTASIDTQEPIVTKDISVVDTIIQQPITKDISAEDTVIEQPLLHTTQDIKTDTIQQVKTNVATTIDAVVLLKGEVQTTLEKYLVGRELWFIEPTITYINEHQDSAQSLIQGITAIDKSTDPIADKKAMLLSMLETYGIENELIVLENEIQLHQETKDSLILDSLINEKDKLIKKMSGTIVKEQNISSEKVISTTENNDLDRLTKKTLPKKSFKKFRKAIVALVWSEPDENANIDGITWQNLMQKNISAEKLDMNFEEFSSLQPENFVALFNHNKAKRN